MTKFFFNALMELGYNVEISEKSLSKNIEEVNKINMVKLLRYFPNFFRYIFNLATFSPDLLVFFISGTGIGLIGESIFVLIARLMGNRYLLYLNVRGYKYLYNKNRFLHKYLPWLFNGAEGVIVLGKKLREEIETFCNCNIHIVPNCIEDKRSKSFEKRNASNIVNILYLSNITKSKGVWILLETIPEITAQTGNVKFTIAGPWQDKTFKDEVMEYVFKNNIKKFIEFPGPVYTEEKDLLFEKSDLFIFPTTYSLEAMPLVILEAMRASLPIISTDIGVISELVADGETGFTVNPNITEELIEKIIYLMNNSKIRKEMGRKGRKRFEECYSFDVYRNRIMEIIEKHSKGN